MARRLLLTFTVAAALAVGAVAQTPPPPAQDVPASLLKGNPHIAPAVRERLVELLQLPKEKLWAELMKWPTFQQMTLQEQASFLQRLAEMRQRLRSQALKKAADLGLKLTPEQEDAFIVTYLQDRMEVERQMWQETQPKRRKLEDKLAADLRREYGEGKAPAVVPPTAPDPTSPSSPR
jgi:hypothetical protein